MVYIRVEQLWSSGAALQSGRQPLRGETQTRDSPQQPEAGACALGSGKGLEQPLRGRADAPGCMVG